MVLSRENRLPRRGDRAALSEAAGASEGLDRFWKNRLAPCRGIPETDCS